MRSVWYMDRHQQRQPAVVVAVDVMHPPPSYCIRLEGADSTRDTEEARLEPRAAQPLPKPAQPAPVAKSAAAETEGAGQSHCCLYSRVLACQEYLLICKGVASSVTSMCPSTLPGVPGACLQLSMELLRVGAPSVGTDGRTDVAAEAELARSKV